MARRRPKSERSDSDLVKAWMVEHFNLEAQVFVAPHDDQFVVSLYDKGDLAVERMGGKRAEAIAGGMHQDLTTAFLEAINEYETG